MKYLLKIKVIGIPNIDHRTPNSVPSVGKNLRKGEVEEGED